MKFKKLFSAIASVMVVASTLPVTVFGQAQYGAELEGSYQYALGIGATTQATIDAARLYDGATRAETAKIMANFAMSVLGQEPDTSKNNCNFNDLGAVAGSDLADYAVKACQLGLMGVGTNGVFNPTGALTRGEFGTILSRVIRGDKYNGGNPFYANHLQALKAAGVMNNIDNPMMPEVRGYMFLMLQRADEEGVVDGGTSAECQDPMVQLSCALGLDDCPATCQDDEDDEDDEDPIFEGQGALEVELSDDTPASATVPGNVGGVVIASFEFTADDSDVRIDSVTLKRYGFSDAATIDSFALAYKGARLSKARNDNSEGEANLAVQGGFVVKAGKTETIDVIVDLGAASVAMNDTFQVAVMEVSSTAKSVNIKSQKSKIMTVGTQDGPTVTLQTGSTVSDVKVGQVNAPIAKFDLANASNTPEQDVVVYSITFEQIGSADTDGDLSNFTLLVDGEEFATVAKSQGDFITFYNPDGFQIDDGNEVELEVRAEILDGVTETIILELDNALDIMGDGSVYGQGLAVAGVGISSANTVTIEAGEVAVSAIDPTFDEARYDRDDVILGKVVVTVNEGNDLELDYIKFTMEMNGAFETGTELFENVELVNETNGGKIDLDVANASNAATFTSDTSEGEVLKPGKNTFRLQADLKDLSTTEAADFNGTVFQLKVTSIGGASANMRIIEGSDDEQVTDITPSTLSWASWDGTDSEADITAVNLSSNYTAVKGAQNLTAMTFDIENNGATALKVQDLTFTGVDFDNQSVSEVRLYKGSIDAANLVKSKAGSQIASSSVTFNSLVGGDVTIPVDGTQRFIVTVSLVDNDNIAGSGINLTFSSARIRDADNNLLTLSDLPLNSPRTINVAGAGTLTVSVDNADSKVDHTKHVLGNTVSNELLALKFVAQDENMKLEDLTLQFSGAISDAVTKLHLFKADGTQIAEKNVSSSSTSLQFTNLNYIVTEGSEYIYVKATTSKVGKDQNTLSGVDGLALRKPSFNARGVSSSAVKTGVANTTGNVFSVVPTRLSAMAFLTSDPQGQESVSTNGLSNGENNLAILKVTADSTTNTRASQSTSPKTVLRNLRFSVNAAGVDVTYINLREVGKSQIASGVVSASSGTLTMSTGDFQIQPGQTKYYVLIGNVSGASAGDSVQVKLENLDSANTLQFSTDETSATQFGGLRLNLGTLTATKVQFPN